MHSPIEPRLPAIFIHVTDMKRAIAFYSHLLGLPITAGTDYNNGIFVFHLQNRVDILLDANHTQAQQPSSAFHMHATCMFATDDIDASYRFMQENDVEVVTEIFRDPNVEFFNFKDPDGNIQMVCRSKE